MFILKQTGGGGHQDDDLKSIAHDIDTYKDGDDAKIAATPLSYQSTPKLRGMGTPNLGGGGAGIIDDQLDIGVSSQRAAQEHRQRRHLFIPKASPQLHVVATLIFMGGALYLGLNVPGVDTVFSFLGATACLGTSFVFPIFMYLTVIDRKLKR